MYLNQDDPGPILKLTRMINAPRQEVFDAWTNPESVKEWMCPEDSSVPFVEMDVRVGGAFRIDMQHPDGEYTIHTGVYREVVPPAKLVFTWVSKNTKYRESLVTVELFARGDATELVLTQVQLPDEEAVQLHTAGWTELTGRLAVLLQKSGSKQ